MPRTLVPAAFFWALSSVCPLALAFQGPVTVRAVAEKRGADLEPTLRIQSSLVIIPVHVTNRLGGAITDLDRGNFCVLEDGVEQPVQHFSKDDAPVSIGLLFDASGSMRSKMRKAAEAAAEFFKTANPADEFFLIRFGETAKLALPFTQDSGAVQREIEHTMPAGETSLLDAIYLGISEMKKAHNWRKALVVLSDGGDNWSRHSVRQVKSALSESDAQLYAMGIFDSNLANHPAEERRGPILLDELAAQSGGRHYPVRDLADLPAISARLGRELRNQYLLGYYPANATSDGKYRRVRVKLSLPVDAPDFRIYYREGYYASSR
jgi:Ca-activated chloride channel family protein